MVKKYKMERLVILGFILFAILILPLIFIALDFWSGIRKAKERGERITSDGWKRTVSKICKYYNAVLAMTVIDMVQMLPFWYIDTFYGWNVPVFPFMSALAVIAVGAIEVKSILEKSDEKTRKDISDIASLAHVVGEHKENIPEIVSQVLIQLNETDRQREHRENREDGLRDH